MGNYSGGESTLAKKKTRKCDFILMRVYSGGKVPLRSKLIGRGFYSDGKLFRRIKYFRRENVTQKVLRIEKYGEVVRFIIGDYSGSDRVNTWRENNLE